MKHNSIKRDWLKEVNEYEFDMNNKLKTRILVGVHHVLDFTTKTLLTICCGLGIMVILNIIM